MSVSRKKQRKVIRAVLLLLFLAVFIFSAIMLIRSLMEFRKESVEQGRLEEDFLVFEDPGYNATVGETLALATTPPETELQTTANHGIIPDWETGGPTGVEHTTAETTEPPLPEATVPAGPKPLWPNFSVNWDSLMARNSDVIGWIWMYDSEISYPVLLGETNNTYIHTTLDGQYAKFGSIFADYRASADFSDRNTIIYGHNGGYGVKFGGLMNYRLYSHWDSHRYICIMTPSGMNKYLIYSAYVTNAYGNTYTMYFDSDSHFKAFIDQTVADSEINTGIVPGIGNRIITLSTCTNNADDERMVVHAVLVE